MDFVWLWDNLGVWLWDNLGWIISVIGIVVTIVVGQAVQLRKIRKTLGGMRKEIQRIEVMIRYLSEQQEYIKDLMQDSRSLQVIMIVLQCITLAAIVIVFIIWKLA